MEINLQALARRIATVQSGAVEYRVFGKQYHGFLGSVGWIIESPALPDKQSCTRKIDLGSNLTRPGLAAPDSGLMACLNMIPLTPTKNMVQ
jgi:hypothetical protein